MSKLAIALATATILIAGGIWRAEAATVTIAGSLAPLTKSYTATEKVAYWRRQYRRVYRRGYYGRYPYPNPCYGHAYPPYGDCIYGLRPNATGIGPRFWSWDYY